MIIVSSITTNQICYNRLQPKNQKTQRIATEKPQKYKIPLW